MHDLLLAHGTGHVSGVGGDDDRSLPVLKECCSHSHLVNVGDLVG